MYNFYDIIEFDSNHCYFITGRNICRLKYIKVKEMPIGISADLIKYFISIMYFTYSFNISISLQSYTKKVEYRKY